MKMITNFMKCTLIGMLILSSMSIAKASHTVNVTSSTTSYLAGTSNVFNFTMNVTTNSTVEYVDNVIFTFPSGWVVTAVAGSSPYNGCGTGLANASFAGAVATWATPGHPSGCGAFDSGSYNFTVTATAPADASGPIDVAAQTRGDAWPPPLSDPQISNFTLSFPQFALTTSVSNINCNGSSDGKIIALLTGGKNPITYAISPAVGTQNPSGTFTGLTAQTYTVTATDADGLMASTTAVVEISADAGTLSSDKSSICSGGSVEISQSTNTIGTLTFVVFLNDIAVASVVSLADVETFLADAESGQYCVRSLAYTVTPACDDIAGSTLEQIIADCFAGQCFDVSDPLCITVKQLSVAPTSISGTTTVCIRQSTTLTVVGGTLGTGAVVEWFTGSCGGTPAGTGSSITVSPTSTTTYYVRFKGDCNTTTCASTTVTVRPLPNITCPAPPTSPITCPATPTFGLATSTNATVTFKDVTQQGSCPGAYRTTRTWTATDICNNTTTCAQTIVVQDKIQPTIKKTGELSSCYASIAAAETAALGLTTATDNCSAADKLKKTVSTTISCPFIVKVTVTDECGNADFVEYTLQDVAAKGGKVVWQNNMSSTSRTVCPSQSVTMQLNNHFGRIVTWQKTDATSPVWSDIPGTAGLTQLTVNYVSKTTYYRCLICASCGICAPPNYTAYSASFKLSPSSLCPTNDPTAVVVSNSLLITKAYPTPAHDKVSVQIEAATEGVARFEVMDITGRMIKTFNQTLTEGYNEVTFDVQNLTTGLHFIKIKDSANREAVVKMSKM